MTILCEVIRAVAQKWQQVAFSHYLLVNGDHRYLMHACEIIELLHEGVSVNCSNV